MEPASAIHIPRIDKIPVALNARPLGESIRIRRGIRFENSHSRKVSVTWVELAWARTLHRLQATSRYHVYPICIEHLQEQIPECVEETGLRTWLDIKLLRMKLSPNLDGLELNVKSSGAK
jgi:hypothetical protein